MPVQAIHSRRLYQQIADQLRAMIESGEYAPGTYLPAERQLSQQFGVSRTSLREALIALEVLRLVKVRVGDGVLVVGPPALEIEGAGCDGDDLAGPGMVWKPDPELDLDPLDFGTEVPPFALLQARRLIEPEAAALAAGNASEAQLAGIREALDRNIEEIRAGSTAHPGDRLLHLRIAEASGNPAYALMMRHLLGHQYGVMFRRLQQLYTSRDMLHRSEEEHKAFVEAICARDARNARRAMRIHLDSVIRSFSRARA